MAGEYGSWIEENGELYKKYLSRLEAISYLAEITVRQLGEQYPNISRHIFVSQQNLRIAIGRYFNDVHYYKQFLKIDLIHPSKIVAHTIK